MEDAFDGLSGKRVAVILTSVFEWVWATRDGAFICTGLDHAHRQAVLIAPVTRPAALPGDARRRHARAGAQPAWR